jgi:glycerophosphoryl diester phosphodiesterase
VGSMAIQAHRGSPDPTAGIRENTLDAFLRARQLGADGVELDVRMTSDGALAIHHDPVIPGVGPITELTVAELPGFVPLLGAALEACHGMSVNVEIKNLPGEPGFDPTDQVTHRVADLVMETGRASSVVISSFWPPTLEAARHAHPDLATGLLLAPWFDPAESVAAATSRGCTAIHPHVALVDGDLVARAHHAGLVVTVWTVNDRSDLEAVEAAGADTVITDDVALARATVGRR